FGAQAFQPGLSASDSVFGHKSRPIKNGALPLIRQAAGALATLIQPSHVLRYTAGKNEGTQPKAALRQLELFRVSIAPSIVMKIY
ncbi:hypothetical protein EA184_27490, partial [Escherichia coli]